MSSWHLTRISDIDLPAGGREAVKWLALALMLGDHVNTGLLARSVPWLYDLGRIVMPTFAAVLAYNLAGRFNVENGRYQRAIVRLLLVGLIAYPLHVIVLGQGWAVANILIGYALAATCMYVIDRYGRRGVAAAAVLVVIGGGFVEFYWAAPLVTLAWWYWWRERSPAAAGGVLGALGLLCVMNGNAWALASLPLILLATYLHGLRLPRWPWAFYVFYPAHLVLLAILANY